MERLHILWTSDNPDTFFNMLARYSVNSVTKGWWEGVNVILWGGTVKLAGEDTRIQAELMEMLRAGVTVEACRDCCENFGVTGVIEKLGITIRSLGEPFTEYVKAGEKIITI
jgi:hypothetical protein